MYHYQVRFSALVAAFVLSFVFATGWSAGVAHAEPGPRPTLTPIPPAAADPVAPPAEQAPPAEPAPPVVAPRQESEPVAPTPTPRRMIMAVVTPIAPVQPTTMASEWSGVMPSTIEGTSKVRYLAPAAEIAAAPSTGAATIGDGLMSYRALLVSLIALDIMVICMLVRRRYAMK